MQIEKKRESNIEPCWGSGMNPHNMNINRLKIPSVSESQKKYLAFLLEIQEQPPGVLSNP